MNVLVTGGCGFIGSNLVNSLISKKYKVIVIDNLSSDAHDEFYFNDKAIYHHNSITDYIICSDIFRKYQPSIVFHLAAESRIQNCIEDPLLALETNYLGTATMLQLCKKYQHNVKRFVFSSTSAIYGLKNTGPLIESMESDCLNAYSLSKKGGEEICNLYSSSYGVDTVCLRYFNVYGPHQPKKGPYAPVIGIFQRQKEAKEALTVVGDGEQTRDYVHVSDVVEANIMAGCHETNLSGQIFNVGTGNAYSVNDIARRISSNIKYIPPRTGEARDTLANNTKIKNYFGWKPKIQLMEWIDVHINS
jgi:nucleoside-diphosphate-sugar epimerase